jgi:HK97 family phage portal protein
VPKFFPSLRRSRTAARPTETADVAEFVSEQKALLVDYYAALASAGWNMHGAARPWPIERAIREGYERVMWVFKAVDKIGENCARDDIPFEVVEGYGDKLRVIEDHPLSRLLNGQANPLETGGVFLERLSAQLLLSKRGAFVEIVLSNMGTPIRLDLLPPGRTRMVPAAPTAQELENGANDLVSHYEVTRLDGSMYDIPPERVRWFRKPHPTDPYSGVTPLEAAGLSVELDHFARLYNVSFLRNDGRPGTVIGVEGEMDPADMERIDQKFGRGPVEAGALTTIAGKITVADLAAKPRDMQYGNASKNSKTELLAAFGMPESQLGNTEGRTYANAEADGYVYWSGTQVAHMSRIASGFIPDVDPGQRPRFNFDQIEVLQLPARAKREEARTEVEKGLRSIWSYAQLAGYSEDIEETPMTRALWLPAGRNPIPANEEDAEALGLGKAEEEEEVDPNAAATTGAGAPDDAIGGVAPTTGAETAPPAPAAGPLDAAQVVASAQAAAPPAATVTPRLGSPEGKAFADARAMIESKAVPAEWEAIAPEDTRGPATAALKAALGALAGTQIDRASARVKGGKTKKGTRHFEPEYPNDTRVGTKALDAAYAADEEGAADDTDQATRPLVEAAALAAAAAWLTASTGQDITAATLPPTVAEAALAASAAAMPALVSGAAWQSRRIARTVSQVDADGGSIADILAAIADLSDEIQSWADDAAEQAAGSATEAGYAEAAEYRAHHDADAGPPEDDGPDENAWRDVDIERQWITRQDDDVRDSHRAAHGQTRPVGTPFTIGGSLVRYPQDPLAPAAEAAHCRCRTLWRQKSTGRFVRALRDAEEAS